MKKHISTIALLGLSALNFSNHAHAQDDVAAFYRGKQIQMRVGSSAGGGYDLIARALVRSMGKHLPGSPTFIVQNVPGAGGLTLANQMFNIAPRDGTVLGIVTNGIPTAPLLMPANAKFDAAQFSWIGSPGPETQVALVWHTSPVKSIDDLFQREILVGGATPGTATVDMPLAMNAFMGTKFKIVSGYENTVHINLAMERGEVEGQAALGWNSLKSTNADWIADKKLRIVAQYGFKKNPELPDVPLFKLPADKIANQNISLMFARQMYGRPFFAPPGIPEDRLRALRKAFLDTMKDPAFLAEAKSLNVEIDPISGEDLEQLTKQIMATSPEAVAQLRQVLEQKPGR
jgi:tripartite-type tricarboxylate transporter receptor subunit TctC